MTKRISFIVIALVVIGGAVWYFFGRSAAPAGQSTTSTTTLPFGNGEGAVSGGTAPTGGSTAGTDSLPIVPTSHLYKIADVPVAGATALSKNGALVVRYVERATGHIFDIDPVSLTKTEIVNTTVPKVYEAIWKPDGTAVVLRTLEADGETIDSTSVALIPPAGTSTSDMYATRSSGLAANISSLSVGQKNIFYVMRDLPQVVNAAFDGSKTAPLWSAPFTEWQLAAIGDASVLITTKPSSGIDGYAYNIPASSKVPQKILGPVPGLMTLPNSALSRIAFSYNTASGIGLEAITLATGKEYVIQPATFAPKCAWSTRNSKYGTIYCAAPLQALSAGEPDLWLKGITHYTDRIWRFDVDTDFSQVLAEPKKEYNADIDAENLFLSPNEDFLFFTNRNDLSLWALRLD